MKRRTFFGLVSGASFVPPCCSAPVAPSVVVKLMLPALGGLRQEESARRFAAEILRHLRSREVGA